LNLSRKRPGVLSSIPRETLVRMATVELPGQYERKVLNAFLRFQDTYADLPGKVKGEEASFQDLMRLILRASELIAAGDTSNRSKKFIEACSEALSWVLVTLIGPEERDIITLQPQT